LHPPKWVSFSQWWNKVIFIESQHGQPRRQTLTRKQLVLGMANREGGAHVDPKLTGAFADLTRSNSLGVLATGYGGVSTTAPPHNAAVRQIAHEVSESLEAVMPVAAGSIHGEASASANLRQAAPNADHTEEGDG
jgi:hypothetical protein